MAPIEEQLKQTQLAYQMAAQMSQFKAGFLARTAHELRSPISSLIGLHQLILSDLCNSPEEEREFLAQAFQSAQRLMKIIDEIVSVSKTEYGSNQLELYPLPLSQVLGEIEHRTYLQAANRNLQIKIASPDPELYIVADCRRLVQALVNLIDIAITYTQEDHIQISAHACEALDFVQIDINVQCPLSLLSEPINLLEQIPNPTLEATRTFSQKLELSPGMKFLLAQTLLEAMQGSLNLSNRASPATQEPLIQLQCLLPRSSAEAFELAED